MVVHGRLLLGYDVVAPAEHRWLGQVRNLSVDDGMLFLVTERAGVFRSRRRLVPWTSVAGWRVGRIELRTVDERPSRDDADGILGRRLAEGIVTDVRFSQDSGRVEAFVLSQGILRDLTHGRTLLPYPAGGEGRGLSGLRVEGHRARRH
jgi:uncharacterized protein YrrD